jgi:epoxyqueuosine reductase QueG
MMETLRTRLKEISEKNGATLFGVANLLPYREYINEVYGDSLLHLDKAVSIGIQYPKDVVNQLLEGPTHTYLYYYKILNAKLDDIALQVAIALEKEGFRSFPVPASQRVTDDRLAGIFSHRMAAHLSGLGWIGKNSSLITREYGPRLRLVTILTDAPLETDEPFEGDLCGECTKCVLACPSGAVVGNPFREDDPLEKRFIGQLCDVHLSRVRNTFGKRICGKCLASCPYGK